MLSRPFDKALHLKPASSGLFAVVLVLLHLGVLLSIVAVFPVNDAGLLLLALLISSSAGYYFRKFVFLSSINSVKSITQTSAGDWSLCLGNDMLIDARLCDDSYSHPLLVILNFKTDIGRISVPVFFDALSADQHRQLRSRLTLSRPAQQERLFRR